MAKQAAGPLMSFLAVDRRHGGPIHRQLYSELRQAILAGRLKAGDRLPSSRTLAAELKVSRGTVVEAFLQLYAEGYVDGQIGAGTYVSPTLPQTPIGVDMLQISPVVHSDRGELRLSERYSRQKVLAPTNLTEWSPSRPGGKAFMMGIPALDAFPCALWGRLIARVGRNIDEAALVRDRHAGYKPLREAIAVYLAASRGVRCTADQIIVVNGSQQAISLIAHVLTDPGDAVWMEDPGYFGAKGALTGAGNQLIPVPVDEQGLNVDAGIKASPHAKAIFVTPSHQMPLGITMSLARRLALLDWARSSGAWIIEDDYDSEFRYSSRPITALQGLDTNSKVLYTGTFSKVLFPGLRLGYLVVPVSLVESFTVARLFADMYSSMLEQIAVAEFILEGHFERHFRRMRTLYAERQAVLLEEAEARLGDHLAIAPSGSGMHVIGRFPTDRDDVAVQRRCLERNVTVVPLSRQYLTDTSERGLLLGYAACPPAELVAGVRSLAEALKL